MSVYEKVAIVGSLVSIVGYSGYTVYKASKGSSLESNKLKSTN